MQPPDVRLHPEIYEAFDAIIDGYFPLAISVAQLMERLGATRAYLEITHAPIMHIPGLPQDAPVPLNISEGRAGLIDCMQLLVTREAGQTRLSGAGDWRWLDRSHHTATFDPFTRLAEPAYLTGFADFSQGTVRPIPNAAQIARRVTLSPAQPAARLDTLTMAGWSSSEFIGPLYTDGVIQARKAKRSKSEPADFLIVSRQSPAP